MFWFIFGFPFCGLGVLCVSFRSLFVFVDSYSGCSKNEKQLNVPRENHFFEYVVFCVFESPDGPLGVILASLGVI